MQAISEAHRDRLLSSFRREALHLEMRDVYATDIERDRFQAWLRGDPADPVQETQWWQPWRTLMRDRLTNGRRLRRLRVVSEPVTAYIRFEWLDAARLVELGEDVRWLPRQLASTLLLPGNDFWLFDTESVAFTTFSGEGHVRDHRLTTDPEIVRTCLAAFDAAWTRAIPHRDFQPR